MRGYVKYFPKKNKGNRANWKIIENGLWNIKLNFATHNEKKKKKQKKLSAYKIFSFLCSVKLYQAIL